MFGYMLAGFFQVNTSHSADGRREKRRKDTQTRKKGRKYKKKKKRKLFPRLRRSRSILDINPSLAYINI